MPSKASISKVRHPRAVAIESEEPVRDDTPFAEGASDELDPDLRHRLISELAYARYCARGYGDGYDLDDWLEAEAEVDHLTLHGEATA